MIKLMSALPNSLLATSEGYTVTVTSIQEAKVIELLVCRALLLMLGMNQQPNFSVSDST